MRMVNGVLPRILGAKIKRNKKILNIQEDFKISVERSKDILDYFGISSTDKDLVQYVEHGVLSKALPIKAEKEYTEYPYSFDKGSLIFMLLIKGVDHREIDEVLLS